MDILLQIQLDGHGYQIRIEIGQYVTFACALWPLKSEWTQGCGFTGENDWCGDNDQKAAGNNHETCYFHYVF